MYFSQLNNISYITLIKQLTLLRIRLIYAYSPLNFNSKLGQKKNKMLFVLKQKAHLLFLFSLTRFIISFFHGQTCYSKIKVRYTFLCVISLSNNSYQISYSFLRVIHFHSPDASYMIQNKLNTPACKYRSYLVTSFKNMQQTHLKNSQGTATELTK